jgi:hypothetical protein
MLQKHDAIVCVCALDVLLHLFIVKFQNKYVTGKGEVRPRTDHKGPQEE